MTPSTDPMRDASEGRAGAYPWIVTLILSACYLVATWDRVVIVLVLDPIKADLGLSDVEISLALGMAFAILCAPLGLLLGRLADSASRRNVLALGMLTWGLATVACGLARNFWHLLFARVGVGSGEGTLAPCAYSMVADYFPAKGLARPVSVVFMGAILGPGLGLVFGGELIDLVEHVDRIELPFHGELARWQLVLIGSALPGLLLAAIVWMFVREPARRTRENTTGTHEGASLREVAEQFRRHWRIYATLFLGSGALSIYFNALLSWAPSFFIRVHGWSAQQTGMWLGVIIATCGSTGALFGGWLAAYLDRRGRPDAMILTMLLTASLAAPPAIAATMVSSDVLSLMLIALLVFAIMAFFAVPPAALQLTTPNHMRGQVSALYIIMHNLVGIGAGPVIVALLNDVVFEDGARVGHSLATLAAIAAPVSLAVVGWGRRHYRVTELRED
jgi:MFS family permease